MNLKNSEKMPGPLRSGFFIGLAWSIPLALVAWATITLVLVLVFGTANPTKGKPMTEMRWLDKTGDLKITFDPGNEDEVEAAEAQFDELVAKGYTAFAAEKDGSKGKKMKNFDARAARIILVPKLAGG